MSLRRRRRRRRARPARGAGSASTRACVACGSTRRKPSSGGRVDQTPAACFVTYQPSAVVQPKLPGSARSTSTIRAMRVRRVVVDRSAREAEAAGDGERARVVVGEPELAHRDLHRRREARVEVEVRDVVDADAGGVERVADRRARSPGEPVSESRSVTNQWSCASAAACRNTMRSSGTPAARAASYEHRSIAAPWSTSMFAHMRFGYGKHTMRLSGGPCGSRRGSTRSATTRAGCRRRPRRTSTRARSTCRWCSSMRAPGRGAQRGLEQRVHHASARPRRGASRTSLAPGPVVADDPLARRVVARLPVELDAGLAAGPPAGVHALGAADEHDVALAALDAVGQLVDEQLRAVAADRR